MTGTLGETPEYHGSLIAFEGPEDIVSTQIRLLPNSSKILILPTLQSFIKDDETKTAFEARSHILKIHKACHARAEMARTFLRSSTSDNKRLVFMNGGTASAQLSCITSICEHETNGDFIKAEMVFNELVPIGIAGLERQEKGDRNIPTPPFKKQGMTKDDATDETVRDVTVADDPALKAMRAAEALDQETAFLQTTTNELDLTIPAARPQRPRSTSVPVHLIFDDMERAAPFYVFGCPVSGRNASQVQASSSGNSPHPDVEKWRAMTATVDQLTDPNAPPRSPSCVGEAYPPHTSPSSNPTSPGIMAKARIVDIRSSLPTQPTHGHKRLKSVDQIYASGISQDISLCNPAALAKFETQGASRQSKNNPPDEPPRRSVLRSKFYSEIPRPTYAKPMKTVIKRGGSSIPLELGFKFRSQRPVSYLDKGTNPARNYVDQGTVTEPVTPAERASPSHEASLLDLDEGFELDATEPFHTVLPMVEDLVIHFKDRQRDTRLEAIIKSLKDGTYPVSMPPLLPESKEREIERPGTSKSRGSSPKAAGDETPNSRRTLEKVEVVEESTPVIQADQDEYDPFRPQGDYFQSPRMYTEKKMAKVEPPSAPTVLGPAPPTPAQTPPPPEPHTTPFHEFDTTQHQTAVCTQNALRSVLNIYFPPEDIGYNQFSFPLLPELNSLWHPIFRESPSNNSDKTKRKVDLILAIGAQRGVEREFLGAISGSLERLGTKPNGTTRSGRLDLRYLIANAMQAFTAQPLANQTQDNPFSNPLLLATLIIPHLETYMTAHTAIRLLLLEYPAEHLSTVLALQRLVGVDLLKVAGIINSNEGTDSRAYRTYRQSKARTTSGSTGSLSSFSNVTSTSTLALSKRTSATLLSPIKKGSASTLNNSVTEPSFSKANFIITSSATESEIATLISTIWMILIDISTFYIPDSISSPRTSGIPSSPTSVVTKRSSQHMLRSRLSILQNPLADPEQLYGPLASAAVMLGFAPSPEEGQEEEQKRKSKYVSVGTNPEAPPPRASRASREPIPPPPPPKLTNSHPPPSTTRLMSSGSSITSTLRSVRTNRTAISQSNKLRQLLGADPDDASSRHPPGSSARNSLDSWFGYEPSIGPGEFADEERRYIPLFNQDVGPRRGNSRKALKWLGLAT
ncbi:hypothetical protein F5Y16DRAFT_105874 [Xylariaceae sp. FL0255]|nr:hypothetical protein F5Y16DRAFT_105874 [Xylariaceae sp. FL0255]